MNKLVAIYNNNNNNNIKKKAVLSPLHKGDLLSYLYYWRVFHNGRFKIFDVQIFLQRIGVGRGRVGGTEPND